MKNPFRRSRRAAPDPIDVPIREDVIRLGQLLKLANLVDQGSDAKEVLAEGLVSVNGEVETRRGRQLVEGDVVGLLVEHAPAPVRVVRDPGA